MDEEAADELVGGECYDFVLLASLGTIVLPFEGDAGVVERDQAAVGDGDAMGVARKVGPHRFWPGARTLAVDDPFAPAQRRQIGGEGSCAIEVRAVAEEAQDAGLVGGR